MADRANPSIHAGEAMPGVIELDPATELGRKLISLRETMAERRKLCEGIGVAIQELEQRLSRYEIDIHAIRDEMRSTLGW